MSLLPGVNIEGFACPVPSVDIAEKLAFPIVKGGSSVSYQPNTANTFSASQISWNAPPPSAGVIMDSTVYVESKFSFRVTLTGAGVPGVFPVQLGTNDAARCLPLSSSTSTCTISLNNASITTNISDMLPAMTRYQFSRDLRMGTLSGTPCMPDTMQDYSTWLTVGSAQNVFAMYGENAYVTPRGGQSLMRIDANSRWYDLRYYYDRHRTLDDALL